MIRHTLMSKVAVPAAAACVVVVAAGCEAPTSQRGLVIVKAVYGNLPDGPSNNVTAQVAIMVKGNTLTVDASNDVFGDPADGAFKKLRVDYTFNGVAGTKSVGEDATLRLPVDEKPLAGKLVVVKAVYGDLATNEVHDVTAQVAAMVKDNALKVVASNENFDDPASGVHKRLRVQYTIGGVARTRTVGEDRTLTISGKPR
jgi:hypothetical protein